MIYFTIRRLDIYEDWSCILMELFYCSRKVLGLQPRICKKVGKVYKETNYQKERKKGVENASKCHQFFFSYNVAWPFWIVEIFKLESSFKSYLIIALSICTWFLKNQIWKILVNELEFLPANINFEIDFRMLHRQ